MLYSLALNDCLLELRVLELDRDVLYVVEVLGVLLRGEVGAVEVLVNVGRGQPFTFHRLARSSLRLVVEIGGLVDVNLLALPLQVVLGPSGRLESARVFTSPVLPLYCPRVPRVRRHRVA